MPLPNKFAEIAKVLQKRFENGEYAVTDFPGERKIAQEFGVSHMTARKAVQHLVKQGVLKRSKNKSQRPPQPRKNFSQRPLVALITPATESLSLNTWFFALQKITTEKGGIVHPLPFVNIYESSIMDAIDSRYDALFFIIGAAPPPKSVLDKMESAKDRLVTLFQNLTSRGITCVDTGHSKFCAKLIHHLHNLGHKKIVIINVCPLNPNPKEDLILAQVEVCQNTCHSLGMTAKFVHTPVVPFEFGECKARSATEQLIKEGVIPDHTAIIILPTEAAPGVYRALYDNHIEIGKQVAVCGTHAPRLAKILVPSLTILETPSPEAYLKIALDAILEKRLNKLPLHIYPEDIPLWIGESTPNLH